MLIPTDQGVFRGAPATVYVDDTMNSTIDDTIDSTIDDAVDVPVDVNMSTINMTLQ